MQKRKQNFILMAPTKAQICAGIHAPDHGMKQNLEGVSYMY